MPKGIYRKLNLVLKNIAYELQPQPEDSMFALGLKGEGYLGGYRAAIHDVILALNGGHPTTRYLWDVRDRPPEVNDDQHFGQQTK